MAICSAVMFSEQGMKRAALVQLWSVIVKMELYCCDLGSLVMKSTAIVSKGWALAFGKIGMSGAFVGRVFTLCR